MTLSPQIKTDTMQLIELAEGVEVEMHPAGPAARVWAWVIDWLWMILFILVLQTLLGTAGSLVGMETSQGVFWLVMFFLNWGFRVIFEEGKRGATPGKRQMKLRVVTSAGAPIGWTAAVLRNLLRAADMLPAGYLTGLISCMATKRFQRLGDLVADTVVIYDHAGPAPKPLKAKKSAAVAVEPAIPQHPPQHPRTSLESLAEPLPPPLALSREERGALVRFAERAGHWSPGRREEMADHLRALTGAAGAEGVRRAAGMGIWLRDS